MAKHWIDRSDPKSLTLTIRRWRHWGGLLFGFSIVAVAYGGVLYSTDRINAIVGIEQIQGVPMAWIYPVFLLALWPLVSRNLKWAVMGERLVFDGATVDILKDGVIVAEFKDVTAVGLHGIGGKDAVVLSLADGKEILVDKGGRRAQLEETARAIAGFLKRPLHASGGG